MLYILSHPPEQELHDQSRLESAEIDEILAPLDRDDYSAIIPSNDNLRPHTSGSVAGAVLAELELVASSDDVCPPVPAVPPAVTSEPAWWEHRKREWEVVQRRKQQAHERTKARNRVNKRSSRAKLKNMEADADEAQRVAVAKVLGDLDVPQVDGAQLAREAALLEAYLAKPGRSQGALKGKNGVTPADLMEMRRVYLAAYEIGNPGYGELAKLLPAKTGRPWSRDQARRIVEWFRRLEAPGGPWSGDR